MFALELGLVELLVSANNGGAAGQDCNGSEELSHEFAGFLSKNGVSNEHLVITALLHTDLGANSVCECADGEWECWEPVVNLNDELAGLLELKLVGHVELTLVDSASLVSFLGLALTGRHKNVETDNITRAESPFGNLLGSSLLVDNNIVSVNEMLLDPVGKNALNRVAFVFFTDFLDSLGHIGVGGSFCNHTLGSHHGFVGGEHGVGNTAFDCGSSNNVGPSRDRGKSIEVGSDNNLGNVSLFYLSRLVTERGVMAHHLVH